ncbi:MAG TPA: DUF488 domain-containing protein [Acidimicrobiales bacterium]|nr:DUF488 domain-containing protein [Acidimicrobiales bacterium]
MTGGPSATAPPALLTVGHGTLGAGELSQLLGGAGVESLVDVRSIPASRRHPQFARAELERWLPEAGVGYRWEQRLGGFRRAQPDSPNVALRHPSFRGYADYMATPEFDAAMRDVLELARDRRATVMCSETLWWRCHRRLLSDAAVLLFDTAVLHLGHDGRLSPHRLTEGVRRRHDQLVYDGGQARLGEE